MVIPFNDCIARPAEGARPPQLLRDHLFQVAEQWENNVGLYDKCNGPNTNVPKILCRLGGLLHDAGKARASWQKYVNNSQYSKKGKVFHSPVGAALFFYVSKKLVPCVESGFVTEKQVSSTDISVLRVGITLDIAGHHGEIRDINENTPWEPGFSLDHFDEMDLDGLFAFIVNNLGLSEMNLTAEEAVMYISKQAPSEWHKLSLVTLPKLRYQITRSPKRYHEAAKRCLKLRTSGLIVADRFDAARVVRTYLSPEMAGIASVKVANYLESKSHSALEGRANKELVSIRGTAQDYAVSAYLKHPEEGIYRLNLPTGLGKTMASLRVALTACAHGATERVIYVAPYISILSQATSEIRSATGLEVIQHHHLSVLESSDENEDVYLLTMESWQAPVVTTTFNQFFLALFPRRAQQTLRLDALRNAFIIVDEAQIIDAGVWKVFLKMIESLVEQVNCQVLFITATMPPVENGLSKAPFSLSPENIEVKPRYEVVKEPEVFDSDRLIDEVVSTLTEGKHVAVVLNTVKNTSRLFSLLQDKLCDIGMLEGTRLYHLSGAMTPLHKSYVIEAIRNDLEFSGTIKGFVKDALPDCTEQIRQPSGEWCLGDLKENGYHYPVAVVCTQVLEAGVDLSFDCIFRELPIMPSIVQVAGRANRHGEKESLSQVRVFRFVDDHGKEPRDYVYRSSVWREETDRILDQTGGWLESDSSGLLEEFFEECYERAPGEAFLDWLVDCAVGNGSALRRVVPFEEYRKPIDVFLPLEDWITPSIKDVMKSFGIDGVDGIYDRYLEPGFVSNMPFVKRKRFFALMQHFTVPVDWKTAKRIADRHGDSTLWRLIDCDYYDRHTGLSDVGVSDFSYYEI